MKRRGFLLILLLIATACSSGPEPAGQSEQLGAETVSWTPERTLERAQAESRGLRIIWFGHSLMKVGSETPIDVPATVDAIHEIARAAGRSELPTGLTRVHYEGPHDLRYWHGGPGEGPSKLRADGIEWDYAIGIGFMHLVGAGRRHPRAFGALGRLSERFKTYQALTPVKYEWIRTMRSVGPHASWLNYVGPAPADRAGEQRFIEERFECIRLTALAAGGRVDNVPVGRAFTNAEEAALAQPQLGINLRLHDHLHYTKQGEFLAANVFFAYLYGVDPTGLPVPPHLAGRLVANGDESAVATFLQRLAQETVESQRSGDRPTCTPEGLLEQDEQGRLHLLAP